MFGFQNDFCEVGGNICISAKVDLQMTREENKIMLEKIVFLGRPGFSIISFYSVKWCAKNAVFLIVVFLG